MWCCCLIVAAMLAAIARAAARPPCDSALHRRCRRPVAAHALQVVGFALDRLLFSLALRAFLLVAPCFSAFLLRRSFLVLVLLLWLSLSFCMLPSASAASCSFCSPVFLLLLPCASFRVSSAMSGGFGTTGSFDLRRSAAVSATGSGVGCRLGRFRLGRRRGAASCVFRSHTSASTATGVSFCQLMPIHRNASRATCMASGQRDGTPAAGLALGDGVDGVALIAHLLGRQSDPVDAHLLGFGNELDHVVVLDVLVGRRSSPAARDCSSCSARSLRSRASRSAAVSILAGGLDAVDADRRRGVRLERYLDIVVRRQRRSFRRSAG